MQWLRKWTLKIDETPLHVWNLRKFVSLIVIAPRGLQDHTDLVMPAFGDGVKVGPILNRRYLLYNPNLLGVVKNNQGGAGTVKQVGLKGQGSQGS